MKKIIKTYLFLFFSCTFISNVFSQYPFEDANTQHYINGSIGEERGGRTRYHYGIDFQKAGGTHVHAIEGGILKLINGAPAISHFGYIHVSNLKYRLDEVVPAGAYIGDVSFNEGHLHLQQNSNDLSINPTNSWESGTSWLNPIGFLNPTDQEAPRIDFVKLFMDNDHTAEITNQQLLFGKIDIIVNSEDQRINSDGSGDGFGISPYIIECELLNENNQSIYSFPNLSFENVPTNNSAASVHGPNANYLTPNFEYWITHSPFTVKYDRYFNTRQKLNDAYSNSAVCPDQCEFKDGDIRVRISSKDNSDNQAQIIIPDLNSIPYYLDNFQPYIQSVDVLIDGINVYSASWECCTEGPEFSGYECKSTDVSPNSMIIINVSTSEPMLDLKGRIVEFPGTFVPFNHIGGLNWTASFQNINYLKDGEKGHLEFSGTDLNGNQILDMKSMAGGSITSKKSVLIPLRENNTTWNPIRKGGDIDNVHEFCFKKCQGFRNEELNNGMQSPDCIASEDLILTYEMESFNGAGDAWIHLEIINGVPPYFIRWTDQTGNIIKQGLNEFDLTDLTAGTYCYSIQDDHCCEIHSCLIICPSITVSAITGLTHPSECQQNDGNIRIISAHANGGRAPYDYHLEDIHGNRILLDPNTWKYEELYAGKYFFIATDKNGCTGSFTIELISPEDFYVIPTITKACDGDNGQIYVEAFSGQYPDDLYDFKWSTGFSEYGVTESTIDQLAAGEYCVTITSIATQCSKEDCFEVKGSGKQLKMKHTLRIPCPNKNNGEIQITVTGGSKPYLYIWSNGDFRPKTTHLGAGQYCVTVTDDCFNTLKQCFDLSNVIAVNLYMNYRCPDKVNVYSEPHGGNPPYTFNWSNGGNTKDLIEVQIGVIYKVTVTDKFGCTAVKDINTNPIELLYPVKPCKGFWDGEMTIKINNPKNERVNVTYDYRPCDDCTPLHKIYNDFSNPIIFTLKDLAGNKEYHFYVQIGDCFFEIKFELGEEDLHEEFKRYEENNGLASCIYDLVCKDNRIVDGKRTGADLKQVGGNCKKFIFKECAKTEVRCAGHPDLIKTIPGQKVHMRRLELIMYAQRLGLDASSLSGNFCDHVWICQEDPFCIVATARGELGGKFKGIEKRGNCYKVKCRSFFGLINQDYYICGESFIPEDFLPYYRNDRNYEGPGGKPKKSDCTPMTLNFTDVLECWPKFVMEDGNKFYESEMAKLVDSYRNRRERYCAWITFCLEDYSIVKTNINDFECEDFHPPINFGNWLVNSTCDPHYFEGNDIVFCECNDPEIIAKYGICLEPKLLPRKCTLTLKNTEEPKAIQVLPFQNGNTHFTNFSTFYQPEGFTTINGIYEDDFGNSYYQKYEPGELFNKLEEFEGALFAHKNAKLDKINLITKGESPNSFEIYSGNYNTIDFNSISSTGNMKFISFYAFENGFTAICEFNGQLTFDSVVLANTSSNTLFILYRNDITNATEISILSGARLLNSQSKNANNFLLKKISNQQTILLNGSQIEIDGNVNTLLMRVTSTGEIEINAFTEIHEGVKIIEYQESENGLDKYVLGMAKGTIYLGNQTINLPAQDQIILMKWAQNELVWLRNFNQAGIDIQNICMECIAGRGVALGLNVGITSSLFKTDPNYQNSTGTDIVILNYDEEGNLIYNKRFGSSSDDEVLKALCYTEENVLYLGGEIKGVSSVRPIGDLDLIKASDLQHSAFISYINFNSTASYSELRSQEKDIALHTKISIISLTPNPVNDQLVIEFEYAGIENYKLEVYDLTGKLIRIPNNQVNNNIVLNTSGLTFGIYFIKLIDGIGNFDMKRFIKL